MKDNLIDVIVKELQDTKQAEALQAIDIPMEALIQKRLAQKDNLKEVAMEYLDRFESDLSKYALSGSEFVTSEEGKQLVAYFQEQIKALKGIYDKAGDVLTGLEMDTDCSTEVLDLVPGVVYMTVYSWYNQVINYSKGDFANTAEEKSIILA
jgi:hypothetical protein